MIKLEHVDKYFGDLHVLKDVNLEVAEGEKLVIIGPSGSGKSTLLRVLDGKLRPTQGSVRYGAGAKPSVFEQQQLRRAGTVESVIWDKYPQMTELDVRSHLARLDFKGEDVFKPCSALSGGELARLRFAEMLLEKPNLMFLDEPTNHLDIYTREHLGEALRAYEGTLILVTHDRYLMNSLGCPVLYLENGMATLYANYEAMMHRDTSAPVNKKEEKAEKPVWGKEQRRKKAQLRQDIKAVEDELEALTLKIMDLEAAVNDPEVLRDHIRLREVCDELDDARFHETELEARWEALVEQQEQMEAEEGE